MLELLFTVVFVWLLIKTIGLTLKITWGAAKIVASILMVLAVPVLLVCFVFVGGLALILPIAIVAIAAGVLKACA